MKEATRKVKKSTVFLQKSNLLALRVCLHTQGNFDYFSQPGVVYGESVARMARGDKRRSWGEKDSGAVLTFGDKQEGCQEHRLLVEKEDLVVEKKDKKMEDSIQLRKDVEELRRRKQELREQFGENEKVLNEVENELAAVGRQGEVARLGVHITFVNFSQDLNMALVRYRGVVADVERLTALLHCLAGRLVNLPR